MANGTIAVSQLEILTQSGTGIITVVPPTTNTNRTLTLPDATTTVVGTDATQTLTNKTLSTGLVMGASAITSGTVQTTTSGTTIDFTSIPSWVKRITVMWSQVSTNGSSVPQIQIGSGSVDTTGYLSGSGFITTAAGVAVTTATSGFIIYSNNAGASLSGSIVLSLLGSNIWVAQGIIFQATSTANVAQTAGTKTLSGTLDRVRLTTVNGTDTFDAGSINILYE